MFLANNALILICEEKLSSIVEGAFTSVCRYFMQYVLYLATWFD